MGKNRRILLLGITVSLWGFLRGTASAQPQGYWKSRLDSELDLKGVLSSRWILDMEESRFLFVEQRFQEEDPYRTVGFRSPLISLGPVDLFGLLREAGSPLGYSLSSTVFREQTGIQLYEGKDIHRRIGFRIAEPSQGLSLGGYKDTGGEPHIFATFRLDSSNLKNTVPRENLRSNVSPYTVLTSPYLEGFLSVTDVRESSIDLEWFPSKTRVLPGPLLHWGGRVRLGMESPLHGSLTLSMVSSRPTHDAMGVSTHLYSELAIPWIELKALSGYCTPHYVTPKGNRTTKGVQHAIGGTLFPIFPFFLSAEGGELGFWDRDVERSFRLGGGVRGSTYRFEVQRHDRQGKVGWTFEGWGKLRRLSGSFTASWDDWDIGNKASFSIRGNYSSKGLEGELWWKGIWNPAFMMEGGCSISLKGKTWKIGLNAELLKPLGFKDQDLLRFFLDPLAYAGVSLFFSTYDSHLPTKRISGSKVRP